MATYFVRRENGWVELPANTQNGFRIADGLATLNGVCDFVIPLYGSRPSYTIQLRARRIVERMLAFESGEIAEVRASYSHRRPTCTGKWRAAPAAPPA
jgi:hypothetical protein